MANKESKDMPEPSDNVKVAKISAVQAVIVALVAGTAGIASTAGLRYVEHSNELARKDKEIEDIKVKSQNEIDSLNEKLHESISVSSLLTATTKLSQEQCYEKLPAVLTSSLPNAQNFSASLRETSDAGSIAGLGGFSVRYICDPSTNLLVVTVAGSGNKSETDRIANSVLSSLQK